MGARRLTLGLLIAVLALASALGAQALRPRPALPVYAHVPAFRLQDQRGAVFTHESMDGRVTVVDFIFTRCPSSCPRLTTRMSELQDHLAKERSDARLVSFSVDPENDTPAVLSDYAAKAKADPTRWTFVTGPLDDVTRAVVLGFKVSAAKIARGAEDYEVTHGEWFVLVDPAGDIRGYYPVDSSKDFEALASDVDRLSRDYRTALTAR